MLSALKRGETLTHVCRLMCGAQIICACMLVRPRLSSFCRLLPFARSSFLASLAATSPLCSHLPPLRLMSAAAGESMRAVVLAAPGGPEQLSLGSAPKPQLKPHELLIRVHATAINRADTLQRLGRYDPPAGASSILGLECSGIILERGSACTRSDVPVGTRVMALLAGGGYAEYAAVHEGSVMPIPASLSYTQAAAIPEVYLTAYLIARQLGELKAGDAVLIHAGASGVGTSLVQLCKLFGATAIVTVSNQRKVDACMALGAALAVNYKQDSQWSATIKSYLKAHHNKDGIDLLLDPVGASHAEKNMDVLAMDARWILYGTMGGAEVDKFPLGAILRKRIRLQGSTLRARSEAFKADLVANFSRECLEAFSDGRLKPIIERTFTLAQAKEAHELLEGNTNIGKIILTTDAEKQV